MPPASPNNPANPEKPAGLTGAGLSATGAAGVGVGVSWGVAAPGVEMAVLAFVCIWSEWQVVQVARLAVKL